MPLATHTAADNHSRSGRQGLWLKISSKVSRHACGLMLLACKRTSLAHEPVLNHAKQWGSACVSCACPWLGVAEDKLLSCLHTWHARAHLHLMVSQSMPMSTALMHASMQGPSPELHERDLWTCCVHMASLQARPGHHPTPGEAVCQRRTRCAGARLDLEQLGAQGLSSSLVCRQARCAAHMLMSGCQAAACWSSCLHGEVS